MRNFLEQLILEYLRTTGSECKYIFWWDMFLSNSLYINFKWLTSQFLLLNTSLFFFLRLFYLSTRFLRNWTLDINVYKPMGTVRISFFAVYTLFLAGFYYGLDSLKVTLLSSESSPISSYQSYFKSSQLKSQT